MFMINALRLTFPACILVLSGAAVVSPVNTPLSSAVAVPPDWPAASPAGLNLG